jgi:hypothetical protein
MVRIVDWMREQKVGLGTFSKILWSNEHFDLKCSASRTFSTRGTALTK